MKMQKEPRDEDEHQKNGKATANKSMARQKKDRN